MTCPKCNNDLADGTTFCSNCGSDLTALQKTLSDSKNKHEASGEQDIVSKALSTIKEGGIDYTLFIKPFIALCALAAVAVLVFVLLPAREQTEEDIIFSRIAQLETAINGLQINEMMLLMSSDVRARAGNVTSAVDFVTGFLPIPAILPMIVDFALRFIDVSGLLPSIVLTPIDIEMLSSNNLVVYTSMNVAGTNASTTIRLFMVYEGQNWYFERAELYR